MLSLFISMVYCIQYRVYSIQYTVYSIQYTLYSNRDKGTGKTPQPSHILDTRETSSRTSHCRATSTAPQPYIHLSQGELQRQQKGPQPYLLPYILPLFPKIEEAICITCRCGYQSQTNNNTEYTVYRD